MDHSSDDAWLDTRAVTQTKFKAKLSKQTENLERLLNSSGFPFQLKVAHEIESSWKSHRWHIAAQEHPWHHIPTGREGFIDLILTKDRACIVVESKRTREGDWLFLIPNPPKHPEPTPLSEAQKKSIQKLRERNSQSRKTKFFFDPHYAVNFGSSLTCKWIAIPHSASREEGQEGIHQFFVNPPSFISQFCIVRGSGEDKRPMLENIGSRLISSIESLAMEEANYAVHTNKVGINRYYAPVIVTNAHLRVCRFDLQSISLAIGDVVNTEFEEVPYIRFHKTLTVDPQTTVSGQEPFFQNRRQSERTILLVQASEISTVLSKWQIIAGSPTPAWVVDSHS